MRNAPPISISSPRETITSFPWANEFSPKQHRGGIVVHHGGRFGAGEIDQQLFQCLFAFAAFAGGEIVFQIDRLAGHRHHRIDGRLGQQCAAQVRVKNRAGGVDDADMAGAAFQFDLRLDLIEDCVIIQELVFTLADICPQLIQSRAALLRHVIAIVAGEQRSAARIIKQAIDGGEFAQ